MSVESENEAGFTLAGVFPPAEASAWRALVDKALRGAEFDRRLVARTADGLPVGPLYTAADSVPDAGPRLRGLDRAGDGAVAIFPRLVETDAAACRAAIAAELQGGGDGIVLRCAAPGQSGLPHSALAEALAEAPLGAAAIALEAGDNAIEAGRRLIAAWDARGIAPPQRRGALNVDPLGALARSGALDVPIARALENAVRFAADPATEGAGLTVLLADARPAHDAGATEAQELAVLAASLVATLRAGEATGLAPSALAPRLMLAVATDTDIMLSIAKIRAARRLAGRILESCGAGAAPIPRLWVTTSERMLARRDPWVNMLRLTIATAAGIMGGAAAVTTLPFTWPLGAPDAFARRMARNIGVVLRAETGLDRVADPAGGAWAVESLTEALAQKSWHLFQDLERQRDGALQGLPAALVSGYLQDMIAKAAAARGRLIATGSLALTGVSAFPRLEPDGVTVAPHPPTPPIAAAARQANALPLRRLAAPFEALRDAADRHAARTGAAPRVFVAALGPLSENSARAMFARNFLAAGGIVGTSDDGFDGADAAVAAFRASGATVACLAAAEARLAALGPEVAARLRAAGARGLIVAAAPKEAAALGEIAAVLHRGADSIETLGRVHQLLGVTP